MLESPRQMCFALTRNIMRLHSTPISILQSEACSWASVAVGLGSLLGAGVIMSMCGRNSSFKMFCILVAVIVELLAIGLITGCVEAFEKVSDSNGTGKAPAVFSFAEDSKADGVINVLRFIGLEHKSTVAALVTWVIAAIVLTYLQIRHNNYGLPINPCAKVTVANTPTSNDESNKDDVKKASTHDSTINDEDVACIELIPINED